MHKNKIALLSLLGIPAYCPIILFIPAASYAGQLPAVAVINNSPDKKSKMVCRGPFIFPDAEAAMIPPATMDRMILSAVPIFLCNFIILRFSFNCKYNTFLIINGDAF